MGEVKHFQSFRIKVKSETFTELQKLLEKAENLSMQLGEVLDEINEMRHKVGFEFDIVKR